MRIVRAAISLADEEGLQALSMRHVADAVEIPTMSIYTHVTGRSELVDLMLDEVLAEAVPDADAKGGWRSRLEIVARENWALHNRHPWTLEAAMARPVLGPNALAKYDYELRTLDGIGLTEAEMSSALALVLGHVEASARRALEGQQAEQRTGLPEDTWWEAHVPVLEEAFADDRYPTAARVGYDPEDAFEFGLQRVLDGIEALLSRRSP